MDPIVVPVPSTKTILKESKGFVKKELSEHKVDLMALCGFGCRYCSSNEGKFMLTNWDSGLKFKQYAEKQLGKPLTLKDCPAMTFEYSDVVSKLETDLRKRSWEFGKGKVLIFSQLTDGFSPRLVSNGTTKRALELLIDMTSFKIRVLTKNAIVGEPEWVKYFLEHQDRFTVGLSTGSLDDKWSRKMELGTSPPSERLSALKNLQDAGVSTYGMLCPVFPDTLMDDRIIELIEQINPDAVDYVWAEPYNDRDNWKLVQKSYPEGSKYYKWFDDAFSPGDNDAWSEYATSLYDQLAAHAQQNGWIDKLKYLLYEKKLSDGDARHLLDKPSILLQDIDKKTGLSQHAVIAAKQMVGNTQDKVDLEAIEQGIFSAIEQTQRAWIGIGMQLIALEKKMESISANGNRKTYWQHYFNVNTFEEYCSTGLNISKAAVYQMKFAVEWIQSTRPELLSGENNDYPYYTNFRALKPHFEDIVSDQVKYKDLIELSYHGSREELIAKRNDLFPKPDISTGSSIEFDLSKQFTGFISSVESHLDEGKRAIFLTKLAELKELLLQ